MSSNAFGTAPLLLEPMRVRRTYRGGSGLDRWHDAPDMGEGERPEEWLASMTEAVNPGFPPMENEGLSAAVIAGERVLLRDLVQQDPQAMLGKDHAAQYGTQPGVLAKIIDSAERLSVQVHPDKIFAKERFHSDYGKTECWHILRTRSVNGQTPYLLMGFRPGVTRKLWEELFQKQDIPAMVDCLNRITPQVGETWLIRGGMPHAIGPGCTLIEIQEPTDYTMRSERTKADGSPIPDALIHQGLGERALMDCFHYDTMDEEQLRNSYCLAPETQDYLDGSRWKLLVGPRDTDCFAMERMEIRKKLQFVNTETFSILTILDGEGTLAWAGGTLPIKKAQQLFLPAEMGSFCLHGSASASMTAIRCHPPIVKPVPPVL